MTTLFVVSKPSEMLVHRIVNHTGGMVVVAVPETAKSFADIGINAIPVEWPAYDVKTRDAGFSDDGMPGSLDDVMLIDGLPAWKILSIDRLRFWYNPRHKHVFETLALIDFDELVVSFDITSMLPWIAAAIARERGVRVVGVKVDSLARREVVDYLRTSPLNELVVSTERERNMLLKMAKSRTKITSIGLAPHKRQEVDGLVDATAVLFESAHDWKFLSMLKSFAEMENLIVCVRNMREWQNFLATFAAINKMFDMRDIASLPTYKRVLLPAYNEEIVRRLPLNTEVGFYDMANVDKAEEFYEAMK